MEENKYTSNKKQLEQDIRCAAICSIKSRCANAGNKSYDQVSQLWSTLRIKSANDKPMIFS